MHFKNDLWSIIKSFAGYRGAKCALLTFLFSGLFNDDDWFLWHLQRRISVEQVGHKSKIQIVIAFDNFCRCEENSTTEFIRLLQHQFRSSSVVGCL